MKFGYRFSNLLGSVYSKGNIIFTPDGNSVISPVGNKMTIFDLLNNKSRTMPIETPRDISIVAVSPNGQLLIVSDENGTTFIINLQRHVVLGEYKFVKTPTAIQFSPNGNSVAVAVDRLVFTFETPKIENSLNPLLKQYTLTFETTISNITWAPDSKSMLILFTNGKGSVRFERTRKMVHFSVGQSAINGYFDSTGEHIYIISPNVLTIFRIETTSEFVYRYIRVGDEEEESDEEEQDKEMKDSDDEDDEEDDQELQEELQKQKETKHKYREGINHELEKKIKLHGVAATEEVVTEDGKYDVVERTVPLAFPNRKCIFERKFPIPNVAKTADYHIKSGLLVIGSKHGLFTLYQMPDFQEIYRLNISSHAITSVTFNNTGEWLAFGCSDLGQLLVWEWRSETYVLKQQGHSYNMNTIAYSSDGQTLATGGDDGKVKVWNTDSGYCFVTFSEHTGPINVVKFSPVASQNVLFTASSDGTVRAFDMLRYRNFRTFVSPEKTQFSCMAIDASGELVCAGSVDTFEICIWSVRTGKITDVLSGHQAPVYGLSFNPHNSQLVSASWDKTARIWDIYDDSKVVETIETDADVLTCVYSPDGKRMATATLDGYIQIYETENWTQVQLINGRNDLMGGREAGDLLMAKNKTSGRAFTKLVFTPNGQCILGSGDSKYICIYHVEQGVLLKRYQTSYNISLDGVLDDIRWKNITEFGDMDSMEQDYKLGGTREIHSLPGVAKGDLAKRTTKKKIHTFSIDMSPTGRSWAAATSEGIVIYSLDDTLFFDPTDLNIQVNPENIEKSLQEKDYLRALVMSLKLNEKPIIIKVIQSIPISQIEFVCHEFPLYYLKNLIQFLSYYFEKQPHIEFQLRWTLFLFSYHGKYIKSNTVIMIEALRNLQKLSVQHYSELSRVCDDNKYTLAYFEKMSNLINGQDQVKSEPVKKEKVGDESRIKKKSKSTN